jgi:hypothetical protein
MMTKKNSTNPVLSTLYSQADIRLTRPEDRKLLRLAADGVEALGTHASGARNTAQVTESTKPTRSSRSSVR